MNEQGPARPLVDWWLAEKVGGTLAGSGPNGRIVKSALADHARESFDLVVDHTGLAAGAKSPAPELVGRDEWVAINLATIREVTGGLERSLGGGPSLPGPLGGLVRAGTGMAAGIQIGLVSGYLAQRVLGQYDIALIGPERPARLLFVRPNLVEAHRRLGGPRPVFLRWIALHEATHAVQFTAVPWLREHLGALIRELLATAEAGPSLDLRAARSALATRDPRRVAALLRDFPFIAPPAKQRRLLDSLQSAMAVVEGYSEHVMDAVGAELGPGFAELRTRLEARRSNRGAIEALMASLLGLNLKLRQYRLGKRFSDEVVQREGLDALNLVWRSPQAFPSAYELEHPRRWLSRVA